MMYMGGNARVRVYNGGSVGISHNLGGTSNYNRLMIHNPHDGSCWMQMTSTASGGSANSDGLSIGLNSSNIAHIWHRENASLQFATNGTRRFEIHGNGSTHIINDRGAGSNDQCNLMEQVNGVHSWGTVLRLHVNSSSNDRASLTVDVGSGSSMPEYYIGEETSGFTLTTSQSGGGWSRGLNAVKRSDETRLARFGFYGGGRVPFVK